MNSFTDNFTINGVTLTAQPICRQSEVLTPDALAFVAKLHKATRDAGWSCCRRVGNAGSRSPGARTRTSSPRPSPSATTPSGASLRRRRA